MLWIESHIILSRHRKVFETARILGTKRTIVVGMLHVFWHTVLEQQEDGDLNDWSDSLIAAFCDLEELRSHMMFQGDATAFVGVLRDAGWLDGKLVHDWLDVSGRYLRGKYAAKNHERLVEIWAKHGRVYGAAVENKTPNDDELQLSTPSVSGDDVRGLRDLWNTKAYLTLPRVHDMTGKRAEKARMRLREHGDLAWWGQVIDRINLSDFLCGKVGGRGWRANIDWLLKNTDNAVKVLEGQYDNGTPQGRTRGHAAPTATSRRAYDGVS